MSAPTTAARPDGVRAPRVGVIVFPGSNCDRDAGDAVSEVLGIDAAYLWHDDDRLPDDLDAVIVPGGFSYGDALRAGAIARFARLMGPVARFAERGGLVWASATGSRSCARRTCCPARSPATTGCASCAATSSCAWKRATRLSRRGTGPATC
jgi:putative intracellular protease/amidase